VYDDFICFLSGEQQGRMEISYSKQQQKQKQKQSNKNQDSDMMEAFDRKNQIVVSDECDDYFQYTLAPNRDAPKNWLMMPISVPIFKLAYMLDGVRHYINVYPTLQFLYSHHIRAEYITKDVKEALSEYDDPGSFCARFMAAARDINEKDRSATPEASGMRHEQLGIDVVCNHIRQSPQYSLAAVERGIYLVGMKDQFNKHDLPSHPMGSSVQYIADEMGFVLFDRADEAGGGRSKSVDSFGPYFIEQYILMEVLSKHEVAQNVLDYYVHQKDKLQQGLASYSETQGKGFICWRFINDPVHRAVNPAVLD